MTALRFTLADLERASLEWGANCGPSALAAICGLTLDEVRPHFPGFKGWTNPSMMVEALKRARPCSRFMVSTYRDHGWPRYGLALIQFEGPWTEPNPARERWLKIERAKRTHWVGAEHDPAKPRSLRIWDVNAMGDGSDWRPLDGWVPMPGWVALATTLAASIKRATGGWHITHAIEVSR